MMCIYYIYYIILFNNKLLYYITEIILGNCFALCSPISVRLLITVDYIFFFSPITKILINRLKYNNIMYIIVIIPRYILCCIIGYTRMKKMIIIIEISHQNTHRVVLFLCRFTDDKDITSVGSHAQETSPCGCSFISNSV